MADLAIDSQYDLARILQGAQLPALPQSAIRLLELSQDPKNGPVEFALPIETDPGLAGQVLKFVNSAYFGFSREISSVKLAITMVGIRTIKNFALWSAVFSLMPNPKCGPFDLKSLWQDSLRRALFARSFGKLLGMREAEEPFAAALLQDMAVPLLAKQLSAEYAELLELREQGKVRLSHLEQERFGWTHYDAAVRMGQQWNLPEEFITLIQHHTTLDQMIDDPKSPPGRLAVALSALLPAGADDCWHECGQFERAYQKLCPAGGPSTTEFLEKIDREFVEFAPLLKIAAPAKSLLACYQEAVQPAG
ncbi:MAG TPA: HDOD domain-containing protein [Pirellulales bacterium]|jgi:HD-like signal output (HDOD) protein|nr:HDOD domain-containing protein [Pirellulales bacterium]